MTSLVQLAELTHVEAQGLLARGAVALWPVGATESHGPHLTLGTDVIIAEHTCQAAAPMIAEELGLSSLALPPLALSVTEYAAPFSGTISVSKEAATLYVRDVLRSTARQGFKAVCLVNAHLEPAHRFSLRDAVKGLGPTECPVALADPCDKRWVPELTEEFQSGSCHGGQYETSLVMAARPDRVRDQTRRRLPEVDIDLIGAMQRGQSDFKQMGADSSYFGRPSAATVSEGQATYQVLGSIVLRVLQEAIS
ncbi:MAG: creatininase family protein [Myxococcota bacterium]